MNGWIDQKKKKTLSSSSPCCCYFFFFIVYGYYVSFVWLWLRLVCSRLKGAGVWKKKKIRWNQPGRWRGTIRLLVCCLCFTSLFAKLHWAWARQVACDNGLIFNCWKISFTSALQRSLQQWPDSAAARRFRFAVFAHVSVRNLWHSTPSLFSVFFFLSFRILVG